MAINRIPSSEFKARRSKMLKALKGAVAVLFSGSHDDPLEKVFYPDPNFYYLTGLENEPESVLVLDPSNPVESRQSILFLRPLNPEVEKWDGYRLEISKPLRETTGFQSLMRTNMLGKTLNAAIRRTKRVACLEPFAAFDEPVSKDLALFKKVVDRIPGVAVEDRTDLLAQHRGVKSKNEIAMLQRAVDITATGFDAIFETVRPGMNEYEIQATLEHAYHSNGARQIAFPTIAGSGLNSTVLHYGANNQVVQKGDLICIDSGAKYRGYSGDITRTVPATGKFSKRQKEVYEVVLKAQQAAIKAVKPGVHVHQIDQAARKVIAKAGYGEYFIHGIGHHLGLETHDITPDGPLKVGSVITIEPGIYIAKEKIGIRIEDDIVVTPGGFRNLSAQIPKKVSEIEKIMGPSA